MGQKSYCSNLEHTVANSRAQTIQDGLKKSQECNGMKSKGTIFEINEINGWIWFYLQEFAGRNLLIKSFNAFAANLIYL